MISKGNHRTPKKKDKVPRSATFKTGKHVIPDHYTAKGPMKAGRTK